MIPGMQLILIFGGMILLIGIVLSAIIVWWQKVDPRKDGRWVPREQDYQRGFDVLPVEESEDK